MSGFEAVGLILGLVPLLISAAEHYEDVCRPFTRYRDFHKSVQRFQSSLRTQRRIYLNSSLLLLQHITDHDTATQILNSSSEMNDELKEALASTLGSSGEECMEIIQTIKETLQKIHDEKFWEVEEDDAASNCKPHDEDKVAVKCWRRRLVKARWSISKARLADMLESLRTSNDEFRTLTSQMKELSQPRSYALTTSRTPLSKDMRKFKLIQKASQNLHDVLGRACTVHLEHKAHFCLEAEHSVLSGKSPPQIIFSLALTHATPNHLGSGVPVWFEVQSIAEDDLTTDIKPTYLPKLKNALEQQDGNIIPQPKAKRAKKCVRFRSRSSSPKALQHCLIPSALDEDPKLPNLCKQGNLCTIIRASLCKIDSHHLGNGASKKCIGVLERTSACRQLVYPSMRDQTLVAQTPMSLKEFIAPTSNNSATMGLSLYEKVRLARKLATAVLQYNSTPWLKESWRSQDIYFFDAISNSLDNQAARLTEPHFSVQVSERPQALLENHESKIQPYADNQILFGLGVVLLELGYESTMASLQSSSDVEEMDPKHSEASCEFMQAKRLSRSPLLSRKMGSAYNRIVNRCLRCDFGAGQDLNTLHLQERFYRDVVCDLEMLEIRLRSIDLDE